MVSRGTTAFPEEMLELFSGKIEMDNLTISRGTPLPMTAAWGRVIWVEGVQDWETWFPRACSLGALIFLFSSLSTLLRTRKCIDVCLLCLFPVGF